MKCEQTTEGETLNMKHMPQNKERKEKTSKNALKQTKQKYFSF